VRQIVISIGTLSLRAELLETATADAIWETLPISSDAQVWGEEVYFMTSVIADLEDDARDVVKPGELAFWPDGNAIAIGFGRTPISQGDETRLASPCNIWAHAIDDVRQLAAVAEGDALEVSRLQT